MTFVRPQDLSFMAGGAVAQRHGVLVRRTSPTEDVAEVFARSTTAPRFDENGVVRNAAIDVPRLSWRDFDGDGVYEQAVLPIAPQTTNLIEFNIPGGTPSDFELSPVGVTNMTDEYYVEIDDGDDLQIDAPANWDPNNFTIVIWGRPSWASDDGLLHVFLEMLKDGNNFFRIYKDTTGSVVLITKAAGTLKAATLTPDTPWSAGDEVFVAIRFDGTDAKLRFDENDDGTLETGTAAAVGTFASGGYALQVGAFTDVSSSFRGGLNIAILNDGSSADPITERYGAGDGEVAEKEWFGKYSDKLVLYAPDSSVLPLNGLGTPAVVRNDTGRFVDWEGIVTDVAANVLRNRHSEGGVRMTLLEAGYINLMTEANLDAWTKVTTPICTQIPGPDGNATSAFTVEDNDAVNGEYIYEATAFAGDAVKSAKIAVKENTMPGSGAQRVGIYDGTGSVWLARMDIDSWDAGDPQITEITGTLLDKWQIGTTGWWVLEIQTVAATAVSANRWQIMPAGQADQTGKIDVFFPAAFDAAFPPRSFLDASEVTTKDEFKKPISGWTPDQGYTTYGEIECFMLANVGAFSRVFELGNNALAGSSVLIYASDDSNAWKLYTRNTAGIVTSEIGGANAPTIGDSFKFRISVPDSGDITWGVSKNGGAEATTTHAPGAWDAAFIALFFNLGMRGDGSNQGNAGHIVWKAESTAGLTRTQMQDLTAPDLFHYASGQEDELATLAWDTATKGTAIPGIDGLGGPWGIADASSVVASSEGIPLPYDSDFGTTIMKLESGPAGSGTRRYLFGLPGSMNDFTVDTLAGMVIGVYIPSSSEITPAQVTTHAVDDQGSSAGDVATATDRWQWLWVAHTWDAGATEAYLELRFADGVSLSGADEVLYMAIPTGASGTIPLVPIPQIAEGTSVVEEEDFYTAFDVPPGAAGFYVELIAWAPGGLLYVGAAGDTGARLMLEYATDGTLLIFFSDGSSTSQKASDSTVSPGSNIKVLGTVTAAGALQITISIDDAAEEESTVAAALELPDDWGAKRVYLGSKGGGDHGTVEILEAKVVRDSTYTLAGVGAVI